MEANGEHRDIITIEDENGEEIQLAVEALFDIEDKTYTLLSSDYDKDHLFVMEVEDDEEGQYLIHVNDPDEREMVLDAYEIAIEADPAD